MYFTSLLGIVKNTTGITVTFRDLQRENRNCRGSVFHYEISLNIFAKVEQQYLRSVAGEYCKNEFGYKMIVFLNSLSKIFKNFISVSKRAVSCTLGYDHKRGEMHKW